MLIAMSDRRVWQQLASHEGYLMMMQGGWKLEAWEVWHSGRTPDFLPSRTRMAAAPTKTLARPWPARQQRPPGWSSAPELELVQAAGD
ncbi:hypothetical protein IAQ61_001330 [Plenodomus lingam]|uniref:uncharacterized protein n=1 Tax=Leptosphaeria maculans TaxID=5022 RepID=UPI003319CB3E|nr:hypothetical protein IAQ61_001330 [Plenodomus lingam]